MAIECKHGHLARSCYRCDDEREIERLRVACSKTNDDVCQTLGNVLGYPRFVDDQETFPGATESNGVCVGDHVAGSIAEEAAHTIVDLRKEIDSLITERDYAVSTIRCYGEILVNAGHPSGDRVTVRENLKRMVSDIAKLLAAVADRDRLLAMHEEFFVWRMCPETKTCPPWWNAARAQADERDDGNQFCIRYMRRAAQVMEETK